MYKDYFKPPYKFWFGETKVFTSDDQMAFDFVPKYSEPDAYQISLKDKQMIIEALNGNIDKKINNELSYKDGTIFIDNKPFIWIRSWGRLTGTGGGLGLAPEKAREIQDSFADFIVKTLLK